MVVPVQTAKLGTMAWTSVVVLVLAPVAAAGTIEDPEVVDAAGDHFTGQEVDPVQALDIISIYLTEEQELCDDATHVTIVMVLNNIVTGNSGAPGAAFSSSVYFTINDNDYRTYLRPTPNLGPVTEPWIYMYDITADSDRMEIPGGIDNADDEKVWWCVPYENLNDAAPGDVVTKVWGRTYLDYYGATDLAPDGAPDSGDFGREYALGGVVAAAGNLTVAAADNESIVLVPPGGSGTFTINVTNHASEQDNVSLNVTNITEGWEATVDPANLTVDANASQTATVTVRAVNESVAAADVTIGYDSSLGATGNVSFTATLEGPPPSPTMDHGNETTDAGNGTAAGAEGALGVPGVGPLLLLGVTITVAAAYRRRR